MDELVTYFETSKSTVGTKALQIERILKIHPFHPDFSTSRMLEKSPFKDLVLLDGFIVPADYISDESL